MNKLRYILLLGLLLCGAVVSAQNYERVLRNNLWNDSHNITGVRQDTVSRSYAEVFGKYEGGEFRDTWQAANGWSAGAVTASIRHLERMTLKGSFSFTHTEGYDMCGSMFIRPGLYPVDILEFTPGRKTLQTYEFDGGLSYDLTSSWRIGAKMDFESANIAKRKDLRHDNKRLDMTVSPGIMYHNGDFAIGANYVFRKTSETIDAEQVGISESSYYAFLDKGQMYGVYSIWTGNGVHLDEAGVNGFPVKDFSNGAALQVQYKGLFAEAEYSRTSGKVGEKEYIWFLFPGNSVNARIGYRYADADVSHYARLGFSCIGRSLDESVLDKVSENGVTTVVNHGTNRISSERGWVIMPEYEFVSDKFEILAAAEVGVMEKMASQMYPYVYGQSLLDYGADIRAKVYQGPFEIGAGFGCAGGRLTEEEWISSTESGVQNTPYRLYGWYERHMEYLTSFRINAGLSLRWNFNRGLYAEADAGWTHAFGLEHISGHDRIAASLRIGYNF